MILEDLEQKFTKYEIARILGARALQIAMDAPLLLKMSEEELENINYNPLEIAKRELLADILPITVNRPLPKKRDEKIKMLSKKEIEELKRKEELEEEIEEKKAEKQIEKITNKESPKDAAEMKEDEQLEKEEGAEEEKIEANSEIMELSMPEDEGESEASEASDEEI